MRGSGSQFSGTMVPNAPERRFPNCRIGGFPPPEYSLSKLKAIEGFVLLSSIAMGITQMLSLDQELAPDAQACRYLRTPPRNRVSEASIMYYFRKAFFALMLQHPDSFITRYILEKQIADPNTQNAA